MKETGNTINPDNIQHFADSAENAIRLGQRQFFTPPLLAAALFAPLSGSTSHTVTDLMCGSGHLLTAAGKRRGFGIDVDARVPSPKGCTCYQADVTRWLPLAHEVGLFHDLLALNPPFSLLWYLDRLRHLSRSDATGVAHAYAAACGKGTTIDSTLATFMLAVDSLTDSGEGFMVCNAATARRLIGDPLSPDASAPETSLLRNVWLWLDIPDTVFQGAQTRFDTAVLYFSASHGRSRSHPRPPFYLAAPSADPRTVERTLATAHSARPFAFLGRALDAGWKAQNADTYATLWDAVRTEYHALHHGQKPRFNLSITPAGTISTHLDPYRKAAYTHDRDLLTAFRSMQGETPAALVVQQASRAALRHAIGSGAWRVDPALVAAVDEAVRLYESVRAPFYIPSPVQSLGWLDEESQIVCQRAGIPGFRPDASYPIRTWIETTEESTVRVNSAGEKENIKVSGRELVVEITCDEGTRHHFHVRRDPDLPDTDKEGRHHPIAALLSHFRIPVPQDVAAANPDAFRAALDALTAIESHINRLPSQQSQPGQSSQAA